MARNIVIHSVKTLLKHIAITIVRKSTQMSPSNALKKVQLFLRRPFQTYAMIQLITSYLR